MRKLYELKEKDLETISGGEICISDIIAMLFWGGISGIPFLAPTKEANSLLVPSNIKDKESSEYKKGMALATISEVCGIATSVVSSVALMGLGAGVLKTGQVLYNHFKGKKGQANNLDKKVC